MFVYVHLKGEARPQEIEAANVEEEGTTLDLVLTNDDGKVVARFALDAVASWWSAPR